MKNEHLRNIAIIAHVDHGKTTLVDQMFGQSGVFRSGQDVDERVMDNMDLEKERGITIAAKNCSVLWNDVKINILDTPGHADFGSEVERALMMVDGAILLVDSAEGPLPQTRFVLQKALERSLPTIVCLNKIDRSDARPDEVLNEIYDLYIDLGASDEQIEFPVLYTIGRDGVARRSIDSDEKDLALLFDTVVDKIPAPEYDETQPFQLLVGNIGYSEYLGRLAVGRVFHGQVKAGDNLVRVDRNNAHKPLKVQKLQSYQGPVMTDCESALAGEIVILAGTDEVEIGDTICNREQPVALPRIEVEDPTVSMVFSCNDSPFSGQEGKFIRSQRIESRLFKESLINVGLHFEKVSEDGFLVKGRGEFQLVILIETMRREGFELAVGRPTVIYKEIDGGRHEPIERVIIDCDEKYTGIVTETLSLRKGVMTNMFPHGSSRVKLEFSCPSRALIGYRTQFLTDTRGTGIMSSYLEGYEPYRGDFPTRTTGSLVSDRQGEAVAFGLFNLEARGKLFITPGAPVYQGMIVGENSKPTDLNVNPCKAKKLTNIRAAKKDENVTLTPVAAMSLEQAVEFIREDELVEVTPESIRLRKRELDPINRRDRL